MLVPYVRLYTLQRNGLCMYRENSVLVWYPASCVDSPTPTLSKLVEDPLTWYESVFPKPSFKVLDTFGAMSNVSPRARYTIVLSHVARFRLDVQASSVRVL